MRGILRAIRSAAVGGIIVIGSALLASAAEADKPPLKAEFFQYCDAARRDVLEQAKAFERKGRAFYWDSYAVRGLAVACEMTGKQEYLDACKLWSDHMIEFQEGMTPQGAYYQWGSKFGGVPFHLYVYAQHVPGNEEAVALADRELRHISGVLAQSPPSNQRDQLALFVMVSCAERISPGCIYRTSKK